MSKQVRLIDVVVMSIRDLYSEEAAASFAASPELQNMDAYTDETQRGLVNRVLINKLLIHRSVNKVVVTDAIYCLVPDGDNESWMNVFKTVILPFLKENKVNI